MNRITCSILSVLQCRHTVLESAPTSVFATEQGKKHCSRKSRWVIGTKNLGLGYEVATTKIPRDSSWLVRQEGYLMACQRGNSEVGPSTGAADLCPHFRRVQPGCWCCSPTHTEVTESITNKKKFAALRQDNAGCYTQRDNAISMLSHGDSNWNPCEKGRLQWPSRRQRRLQQDSCYHQDSCDNTLTRATVCWKPTTLNKPCCLMDRLKVFV